MKDFSITIIKYMSLYVFFIMWNLVFLSNYPYRTLCSYVIVHCWLNFFLLLIWGIVQRSLSLNIYWVTYHATVKMISFVPFHHMKKKLFRNTILFGNYRHLVQLSNYPWDETLSPMSGTSRLFGSLVENCCDIQLIILETH